PEKSAGSNIHARLSQRLENRPLCSPNARSTFACEGTADNAMHNRPCLLPDVSSSRPAWDGAQHKDDRRSRRNLLRLEVATVNRPIIHDSDGRLVDVRGSIYPNASI